MSSGSSIPRIQVFRPTVEEFKDFSGYIAKMETMGAHKAGLAKIIPPEGWCPRKKGYGDINLTIPSPISQVVNGRQGLYQQYNIQKRAMTVKEFKKLAESLKFQTPPHFDYEDLERKYWKNITYNSPIYGADVSGSLYDHGVEEFNIQHLNSILDMVKQDYAIQIEGVNTAYLYFGMWKTTFAWHTEDMDLYSINYLHFGAPKSWYVVPPEHGRRLERLASNFFHGSSSSCPAFLRHKMTIISPQILKQYSIPYNKITQEPGEFMITFPFGYHSGFNHGYNCAESTNFAMPRWVEYGKRAISCTCRNDCVKICMDMFVRKFQPERYELWRMGKDYGSHPEDPSRHYAAPPPNKLELAIAAQRERKTVKATDPSLKLKRHPISRDIDSNDAESDSDSISKDDCESCDSKGTEIYDINEDSDKNNEDGDGGLPLEKTEVFSLCSNSANGKSLISAGMSIACPASDVIEEPVLEEIELMESKSVVDTSPIYADSKLEQPPALKPFWDQEQEVQNSSQSYITADLFAKYPALKQNISSGAVSLVSGPRSLNKTAGNIESLSNSASINAGWNTCHTDEHKTNSSKLAKTNESILPDWKGTSRWKSIPTQGLKVKFVQPKQYLSPSKAVSSDPQTANAQKDLKHGTDHTYGSKKHDFADQYCAPPLLDKDGEKSKERKKHKRERKSIKAASETIGNWAQPILELWQHRPFNFEEECKFNDHCSSVDPHCAICMVFLTLDLTKDYPNLNGKVPPSSKVKMPSFCFGDGIIDDQCILDSNPLLSRDGSSPLLTCSKCKVCVHATCYGVTMLQMGDYWLCSRCSSPDAYTAECCLCVLRGGALKPTNNGKWSHVLCAILIPETFFENVHLKEPVNVSKVNQKRQNLKCKYCFKSFIGNKIQGACVQCLAGKCYLSFHVTCGHMAGVMYEANDWPEPINIVCTKHIGGRRKPQKRNFTDVEVGDRVLSKHRNKRYYWVDVKDKYMQEYYSVLFEDNSTSTNTLPEDIVYRETTVEGCPDINEKIRVKWTDGIVYSAIFKGSRSCEIFQVEFDDGSEMTQERWQIYSVDETIPKDVATKMSHSTERQHIFKSDVEGKRTRVTTAKYMCSE